MAKRQQVILKDPEYKEIQRAARSRHMSIAEWVRQALVLARCQLLNREVKTFALPYGAYNDAVLMGFSGARPAGDTAAGRIWGGIRSH
jgi:hypothetical protein